MADECRIAGPYLPVGDTDWVCRTHDVEAVVRDPARFDSPDLRKADMVCPVRLAEDRVALSEIVGRFDSPDHLAEDVLTSGWLRQHDAEVAEAARADERAIWMQRLAALCDDDWLRRRDRCMGLHGSSSRHDRSPSGAWEHAATILRLLLEEHGYESDHDSYLAWVSGGRDRGEQERAAAAQQGAGPS